MGDYMKGWIGGMGEWTDRQLLRCRHWWQKQACGRGGMVSAAKTVGHHSSPPCGLGPSSLASTAPPQEVTQTERRGWWALLSRIGRDMGVGHWDPHPQLLRKQPRLCHFWSRMRRTDCSCGWLASHSFQWRNSPRSNTYWRPR